MMSDRQVVEMLNCAFAYKYNSLAAYIVEARPHIEDGQEALLAELKKIAEEDQREMQLIAQAIEDLDGVPTIVPHDPSVSELNYLSLISSRRPRTHKKTTAVTSASTPHGSSEESTTLAAYHRQTGQKAKA